MSKIFLNSIAGVIQGNIPVYNMDIKYTGYYAGEWGGEVSNTADVSIVYQGSTNKIRGCSAAYSYINPGSGNIDNADYQNLMKELQAVGGFAITGDFAQQRTANIIWQLPTTKGYLTYIRVFNQPYNIVLYKVVASKFNDIAKLVDCVLKDGVGYDNARILDASNLNSKTSNYFFYQENFELQKKSVLRFGYIYDFDSAHLSYSDAIISMPFDQNIDDLYIGTPQPIEFDDDYGQYSGGGGYGGGSFDDSSDAFGLPTLPTLGVSEVGFINVYNPSKGQLQGFADELFPDFVIPEPSTAEGIEAVAENLANTFEVIGDFAESFVNAGLVNYVIDCHIVPVAPATSGTAKIKVGFKTFEYTPAKVISDYVAFDCGSLEIAEYYQNFLDYEGTRAKLYLPFVGFVDVKPEWFQSGKLGVTYHFNIIDGSCIAFVIATSSKSKLTNTVVATFGGNCCVHMPITGVNYSSMISGVVGGAVGIASNASNMIKTNQQDKGTLMSNIEGATGIASNLADAIGSKPSIEQSNGYNAGMSFMCYRRPYLLIERPVASFSKNYPHEQGLPLNATQKLSNMRGFTTCENVNLDSINCTEEERGLLREALKVGCIF